MTGRWEPLRNSAYPRTDSLSPACDESPLEKIVSPVSNAAVRCFLRAVAASTPAIGLTRRNAGQSPVTSEVLYQIVRWVALAIGGDHVCHWLCQCFERMTERAAIESSS